MSISERVDQQIAEMVADGRDPGGIVLTPKQLMRWKMQITGPDTLFTMAREGSGWQYRGLTIYRSYHVSGPAVVDKDIMRLLLRQEIKAGLPTGVDAYGDTQEITERVLF